MNREQAPNIRDLKKDLVDPSQLRAVREIGPYTIDRRARPIFGTAGAVLTGQHTESGRLVAIKLSPTADPKAEELYTKEADNQQLAADATAFVPGVEKFGMAPVPIVQFNGKTEVHDRPYIVMEYIDGRPLSSLIGKNGMNPDTLGGILTTVGYAADAMPVIHADLKPDHILVRDGRGIVIDFDSAQKPGAPVKTIVSSPSYTSPDQVKLGNTHTKTINVWQIGATLLAGLTGKPLQVDSTQLACLTNVYAKKDYHPFLERRLDAIGVDGPMKNLLVRALHFDPDERFGTSTELVHRFKQVVRGHEDPTIIDLGSRRYRGRHQRGRRGVHGLTA